MSSYFVIYIFLLLMLREFGVSISSKPKVDEQKLKEIADLRKDLNEAFEKDIDMKTNAGNGVIVQPNWTQDPEKNKGSAKVVITKQNLQDTAAIRDEIQSAVNSNTFVKGEEFTKADQYFEMQHRSKSLLSNLIGSENSNLNDEEVGFGIEEELQEVIPNVVQSSAFDDIDIEMLDKIKISSRRSRETLVLQQIIEDLGFDLGEDVREWKHVKDNGTEYLIGLRENDLLIVEKSLMKYTNSHVVHVNASISYLESFWFWNIGKQQQEGIILVAVGENVLWFQVSTNVLFWKWSIGMLINGLTYFKVEQEEYLAVSFNMSARTGFSTLNIYQFDINTKEFWIVQKLQFENSCSETVFLDTGRDVVLAVVQKNLVEIFVFNPHADELNSLVKFEHKTSMESEGIESISAFQMGGLSYLAIGGLTPKILLYSRGEFVPKTIFGQNFGLVELFLPIPTRTYRDDLVLLVQHRVSFDSHDLVVLEALIWNGDIFEVTIPAPCVIGNKTFAFGVGCLLDVHRDNGIKGSVVLKRNNDVFVIVPRHKAESGLFEIKTELLSKNSELVDLEEIFIFLKDWVKDQENQIEEFYKYLKDLSNITESMGKTVNLTSLKTPELDFNGPIGEIFINDYQWIEEDSKVSLEDLIGTIEEINNGDDVIRNRRHITFETLDFDNVETYELQLQLLNGEQLYIKNSELIFPGTVSFQSLNILNELQMKSDRYVRESSIKMDENLKFETINNINWNDFIDNLIFRNLSTKLDDLQVLGEVVCEGSVNVNSIGNIKFPEEFLWSSGEPIAPIVRRKKYFLNNLVSNALDTGDSINGVNPFDIITLSDNENVDGFTTFRNLEISERIMVNGTPQGKGFSDFLSNPTLLESDVIQSVCNFLQLEVKGSIRISDAFNGNDLDLLLSDVIYKRSEVEEEIFIRSKKFLNFSNFSDSRLKLNVNILNKSPLDTFVTKNSQQSLNLKKVIGNIYFNNLKVSGSYDSVVVNELKLQTFLIDEDNFIKDIEFKDKIYTESINIIESLNSEKKFKTCNDNFLLSEVVFDVFQAQFLFTQCEIKGSGLLKGMDLKKPLTDRKSTIFVEEMILSYGLQLEYVFNVNTQLLLTFLEKVDRVSVMMSQGNIFVEKIFVDGDVKVNKLNSLSFVKDIKMGVIFLNHPNILTTELMFRDQVFIQKDITVNEFLNEINFSEILNDIAFRSEQTLRIKSSKDILTKLLVAEDITVNKINKIDLTEIATKQTVERFNGIIEINGNLTIQNVNISGFFNDFSIGKFAKMYRRDADLNTFVYCVEVIFEEDTALDSLYIFGELNSIGNVNEFFENIVYKNNICMLKGKTTFKGITKIEKGAYIKNLNGRNVGHLMRNFVFIDDPVPIVIFAPVLFKNVVQAMDVTVKRSVVTTNLLGCQLNTWKLDTVRKDKISDLVDLVKFAPGTLDDKSLYTIFLNGFNMDFVVTLHTSQNLSNNVVFTNLYLGRSIKINERVNNIDLKKEMRNTFLKYGKQLLKAPITMQSCTVVEELKINSISSNGVDLQNLALLHQNLELSSAISFSKIITTYIISKDLISGINFNIWLTKALFVQNQLDLTVTGDWKIKELNVTSHTIKGDSPKNNLSQLNTNIHKQYNQLYTSFSSLCEKSMKFIDNASKKTYFPRYIEKSFDLEENQTINKVFFIVHQQQNYIMVNTECISKIFAWDEKTEALKLVSQFDSGLLEDVLAIPGKDNILHFITDVQSFSKNCSHKIGVNTWIFDFNRIIHLKNLKDLNISSIFYPGKNKKTFFAIDEGNKKVYQLTPNSDEKRSWNLPPSEKSLYRFLPSDANVGIALTNGQQIVLLNQPVNKRFRRRIHRSIGRRRVKYEFKSHHKTDGKEFNFSDFQEVIVRTLRDLVRLLNIKLTEFGSHSISEDLLQDEHLKNDFIAILQEIQNQNILPQKSFVHFCFDQNEFFTNSAHILAAKVVQVVWPALVEIEEVHGHLRSNEDDHQICANIYNTLCSFVNEVLQIASDKNVTDDSDTTTIKKITSKIQEFQIKILQIIDDFEKEFPSSTGEQTVPPLSGEVPIHVQLMNVNNTAIHPLDEPFIGQPITGGNLLAADSPYLPARGTGEIVSLKTGISSNFKTLIAVTEPKEHLIPGETDFVKVFFDVITGSLFQTLSAYKPRFLTTIRVQNENLFAFVEDKNLVRVFIYKGIQGFVDLVKFRANEEIFGLTFLSLDDKKGHKLSKTFLMINGRKKVEFYEILMFGDFWFGDKINCNLWENN